MILCGLLVLQGFLLFRISVSELKVDGSLDKSVWLGKHNLEKSVWPGERNIKLTCNATYSRAVVEWCYDPTCNTSVAHCTGSICSKATDVTDVCSRRDDRTVNIQGNYNVLLFESIKSHPGILNIPYYCVQTSPVSKKKMPQFRKVILRPLTGVKIFNSTDKEYKKFKWTLGNNVDINCVGSSMSAELIWYYNANCSRAIGNCSQSGLTHSPDICSEKEEGALVLKFRPALTAEMGRKWYFCRQRVPLIENSSAFFLKTPRAGIIIPGEKNKLVELGQRGVSFGCKSHTHTVTWCYDSSFVRQVILCSPNRCSNVQQICYCHDNDGSIMLNFPEITVEMLGSYYCIGEAASDTVRPVQLIMETPSSPLVQESVTKSTHAPSSYQVMIPSPTSSPSLQSKPPSQSLSTSSHSSSHLFMSPTISNMSIQLISTQSTTDIPDVEPRYIQSENQVNTTAAISIVSGAIVGLLVVLLAVTCHSKLWARRWSLLHFGELSSKDEKEWKIR